MGLYPHRVDAWTGASQGYEVFGLRDTVGVKFETINVPPEVTAARLPGAGARFARRLDQLPHVANWAVALKADAEGRVRPSLLFGDYVRYDLTLGDLERLAPRHAHARRDALRRRRARGRHAASPGCPRPCARPTSSSCSTWRRSTRAPTAW